MEPDGGCSVHRNRPLFQYSEQDEIRNSRWLCSTARAVKWSDGDLYVYLILGIDDTQREYWWEKLV
jgi:hypothetical protein